jgi:hypothetical protein
VSQCHSFGKKVKQNSDNAVRTTITRLKVRKLNLEQAIKAQRGSRGTALLIL